MIPMPILDEDDEEWNRKFTDINGPLRMRPPIRASVVTELQVAYEFNYFSQYGWRTSGSRPRHGSVTTTEPH